MEVTERLTLVVDTNFFLQYRQAKELPWSEITDAEEVELLVSPPVQDELDRQKSDSNTRRQKRARAANGLLRQALRNEARCETLRIAGPKVTLKLIPKSEPTPWPQELEREIVDDAIVATALAYNAELLTGDVGMALKAENLGMTVKLLPDSEAWLLPAEPDQKSKELADLRRRVAALETSHPDVSLGLGDEQNGEISQLAIEGVVYEDSEEQVDWAIDELKKRHPMREFKRDQPRPESLSIISGMTWSQPTEVEFWEYETEYAKWIEECRRGLHEATARQIRLSRRCAVPVAVNNRGGRPALHVILEVSTSKGLRLGDSDRGDDAGSWRIPSPPAAPTGVRLVSTRLGLDRPWQAPFPLSSSLQREGLLLGAAGNRQAIRDRHGLYVTDRQAHWWRLECEEIRHQMGSLTFTIILDAAVERMPEPGETMEEWVKIRLNAANVAEPLEETRKVELSTRVVSSKAVVMHLL